MAGILFVFVPLPQRPTPSKPLRQKERPQIPKSSQTHGLTRIIQIRAHLDPSRQAQRAETSRCRRRPDQLAQRDAAAPWRTGAARGAGRQAAVLRLQLGWAEVGCGGEKREGIDGEDAAG
jgi:hypothetical protein